MREVCAIATGRTRQPPDHAADHEARDVNAIECIAAGQALRSAQRRVIHTRGAARRVTRGA